MRQGFASGDGARVDMYLVRYLRQRPDSKLVSTHNRLHPGWEVSRATTRLVDIAGRSRSVLEQELVAGSETRLAWTWYVIGGTHAHGRIRAKLLEVPALLRGRRDGALVALSSACSPDCGAAATLMERFVAMAGKQLAIAAGAKPGDAGRP
jgi:EpsI family protein